MLKIKLLPLALLAISHHVLAQQLPGAGSQIQQIPPIPMPQKAVWRLSNLGRLNQKFLSIPSASLAPRRTQKANFWR